MMKAVKIFVGVAFLAFSAMFIQAWAPTFTLESEIRAAVKDRTRVISASSRGHKLIRDATEMMDRLVEEMPELSNGYEDLNVVNKDGRLDLSFTFAYPIEIQGVRILSRTYTIELEDVKLERRR